MEKRGHLFFPTSDVTKQCLEMPQLSVLRSSPGISASNSMSPYKLGYLYYLQNLGEANSTWFIHTFHEKHDFNHLILIEYGVCSCVELLIFTDDRKEHLSTENC